MTSADSVNHVVDRNDAVLSTLGHAKGSSDNVPARATSNVITAMDADGVDRLVVLSSPAVDDPQDRPALFYRAARAALRVVMPRVVRDHREQARLIEESDLAWTLVRGPLLFTDGPRTGRYHAGPITAETGARISRADLADETRKSADDHAAELRAKTQAAADQAESDWREVQSDWDQHIQRMHERIDAKKAVRDAKVAEEDAEWAEADALDAIDFASSAVEEAEYAVLDAMRARKDADVLAASS